jgi:hypothetical protein
LAIGILAILIPAKKEAKSAEIVLRAIVFIAIPNEK